VKRSAVIIAITIFALPPLPAQDQSIIVNVCGAHDVRVPVPAKGDDDNDCCRKACHAATDRRKKANGLSDDNCC